MIPAEIIEKKRDGYELTAQEINWFVEGVIKNKKSQKFQSPIMKLC